jgi:hypothetical protein
MQTHLQTTNKWHRQVGHLVKLVHFNSSLEGLSRHMQQECMEEGGQQDA